MIGMFYPTLGTYETDMMYVFPFDVEFIARLGDNVIKMDRLL